MMVPKHRKLQYISVRDLKGTARITFLLSSYVFEIHMYLKLSAISEIHFSPLKAAAMWSPAAAYVQPTYVVIRDSLWEGVGAAHPNFVISITNTEIK